MKKSIAVALTSLLAASLSYAASNEVFSVNVVGFQRVELPPDLQIIAVPFEVDECLNDILGQTGNSGATPDTSDNVYLYDGEYTRYFLFDGSIEGIPAGWVDAGYNAATNVFLTPQDGIFYKNYASATTNVFVGDVVMEEAITNAISEGLNLLAFPFSSSVLLTDLNFENGTSNMTPDGSDNIFLYNNGEYVRFFSYDGSIDGIPAGWVDTGYNPATNILIASGQGFWYKAVSSFEWVEQRPYLND